MKKITFLLALFFAGFTWQGYAQLTEDFEVDPPAGWTFMSTEVDDPGFIQTTSRVHSGTYSFYHNDDNVAVASTSYMISPAYTVVTGDELNFWYNQNFTVSYYDYSGVWISTASNDPIANPGDFMQLEEFGQTSEDVWTKKTYDLSAYVGQTVYVAFKYTGDWATELYIDDFSIEVPPTCPVPYSMMESNLTDTSVDLAWTAGSGETMWEVVYDVNPYAMPANGMLDATAEPGYVHITPDPMVSLSGLIPGTTYDLYYRAHCGGTDYSDWVSYSFITPPANDTCDGVIDLGNEVSPLTASTVDALHDYEQDCLNTTAPDVVYSIMVPMGYTLNIGQDVNDYDSKYRVGYGGDCPGDILINCTDDPDVSTVTWYNDTCMDQVVYWVQSGYSAGAGSFTLSWSVDAPMAPANDDCANAEVLNVYAIGTSAGNEVMGSTMMATESAQGQTSCDSVGTNLDVFYEFTVPAGETGVVAYFGGCVASDMEVTLFDTCGGTEISTACQGRGSIHLFDGLTGGTTYLLQVWNDDFDAGDFTIAIESIPPPPANDNICDAIALTVDATSAPDAYTQLLATAEPNEPEGSCFNGGIDGSVWFTFVAPASGNAFITTDIAGSPLTDTEIAVYEAPTDCADPTTIGAELGCDQDGGIAVTYNSILALTGLTAGNTYYIQVDRWGGTLPNSFGIEVLDLAFPECATITSPADGAVDLGVNLPIVLTWDAPAAGYAPDSYNVYAGTDPAALNFFTNTTDLFTVGSVGVDLTTIYWQVVPVNAAGEATGCSIYSFTTMDTTADNDGDGVANGVEADPNADGDPADATDINNPCDPVQAPGYVGYDSTNAVWLAADCDGDGQTNEVEFNGGSDPYDANSTTSISDLEAVGFTYYPNPVNDSLTMKANENISSVSVFNMLGQEVKRSTPSALETNIDMSNLANGTYFVKAQVGDAVGTFKIVKK